MNTARLSPAWRRLSIALALSAALHTLLLWLPAIELPQADPDLPPLAAQLIPLPQVHSAPQRRAAQRTHKPAAPAAVPALAEAASAVSASAVAEAAPTGTSASAVAATPLPAATVAATDSPASIVAATDNASSVAAASAVSDTASASAPAAVTTASTTPARPTLPHRAFLKFSVRLGQDGLAIGEARHELEISDDHYDITATTRTIGLARLVKSYQLVQHSQGSTDGITLHPERYSENKQDDGQQRKDGVRFDYAQHILQFDSGHQLPLGDATQDLLSMMYQFPPLPASGDVLPIAITNGRDWERYRFEVTTNEEIITPLGKLHTVHFRKLHAPGKEGLEIWFAQEYRLLPVKLRHLASDGSIAGEAVITDIRLAEN